MKKLMIAAALAAAFVGTASAETKDCEPCAWAYKIQLVAKTTVAGNVSNYYAKACGCYRKPTMGKVVGYIYGKGVENTAGTIPVGCGGSACTCNDWKTDTTAGIVLWKAWNKKPFYVSGLTVKQLDRIGYNDRSTVEAVFDLGITDVSSTDAAVITLAGFGKAGHRANNTVAVKSLSGFFAGQMLVYCDYSGTDQCGNPIGTVAPEAAHYWALCDDADYLTSNPAEIAADPLTAAYGKWQMVWDDQLLARFKKEGIPATGAAKPAPSYYSNVLAPITWAAAY